MADSAEDIFGPGVLNVNIDELAASRTQAATTASQTIALARQLISEHNSDLNAHPETTSKYANSEDPGVVVIDPDMTSTLDYAVPNTAAVKNYVGEIATSALTYAGQLDISAFDVENDTIAIDKAVKKGNLFIISGAGSFEFNGHTYSSEDYIIAKNNIAASATKTFSAFDWFNVQDVDVVKLDKVQNLTNKNLSDATNVYRDATTDLNGAVLLADDINDARNIAVPNAKLVKSKLAEKLSVIDEKIKRNAALDDSTEFISGFKPLAPSGIEFTHLDTDEVFNLEVISKLNADNEVVNKIYMPSTRHYTSINQTEVLATKSYVDSRDVSDFLQPNKNVATPAFTEGVYTIYKNDGTFVQTEISNSNKTFENGYKVKWSGKYKWTHSDSTFDPKRWSYSGFSLNVTTVNETVLPSNGVASDEVFSLGATSLVTENASGTVKLFAPKVGLVIDGTNVVPATGENEKSATLSISFNKKYFWGYSTNSFPTIEDISNWSSGTIGAKTTKFSSTRIPSSGTMPYPGNNDSFMFIVYPADMSDLTSIKATLGENSSDATNAFVEALNAEDTNTIKITSSDTGLTTTYKVYRTTAMSSVTGVFFNIS